MVKKTPTFITLLLTLLILLVALLSPLSALATFTASVDRNVITQNETIDLTLRVDNQSFRNQPDTTPLQQNFNILGNRRNSQFQMINGQTESRTDWVITLAPKHTGAITIPAIPYNGETSEPIHIDVRSNSTTARGNNTNSPVFIATSLSLQELYIQQETVLTLKIYYSVPIVGDSSLTPLEVSGAIVHQLGDTRKYEELNNGQRYGVFEIQYSIYPQESGTLTIPTLAFTSSIVTTSSDPYNPYFSMQRTKPVRANSAEITLNVKPTPANYPANAQWLPTSSLTLKQHWSSDPNDRKTGDPLTRTITVEAKGLTVAQLPLITIPTIADLKIYPDQAKNENIPGPNGMTGRRTEAIALVPTQSGKITLPAIHYTWFNTTTGNVEKTTLPESIINVAAASTSASPSLSTSQTPLPTLSSDTPSQGALLQTHQTALPWMIAAAVFSLLWLATLGFYFQNRKVTANNVSHTSHIIEKKPNITEKSAFHQLSEACRHTDLQQIKHQFIVWAALFQNRDDLYSLAATSQLFHNDALTQRLESLEKALYSGQSNNVFNSNQLLEIITGLRQSSKLSSKASDNAALSPFNP